MSARTSVTPTAHPHVGGENCVGGCPALTAAGSSPRRRGKLPVVGCFEVPDGLIPT